MSRPAAERRRENRLALAEPILARFGTSAVVVLDLSPSGARIEHYSRLDRGTERPLRVQWGRDNVGLRARVVRSKIDRFIPGDQGLTVYRSGLQFDPSQEEEIVQIRQVISNAMAATLVEQVANARGFWTADKEEMPIFRHGVLTRNDPQLDQRLEKYLTNTGAVKQRGFIRVSFTGASWSRKWTVEPTQPENGFTISADEPEGEIELLARSYRDSGAEGRELIRKLAAASIERHLDDDQKSSSQAG